MRKGLENIYLISRLVLALILLAIPSNLHASVNVYSLNYKDAIIVFEKTGSVGECMIKVYTKNPNPAKKIDNPMLSPFFLTGSRDLVLCEQVEVREGHGCSIVNMPTTKDKLLVSQLWPFTKVVRLHWDEIRTRLLLDPPMPVLTMAQLCFSGDEIASGHLPSDFYLLAGTEPIPVRITKLGTGTYELRSGSKLKALLKYKDNILERADFLGPNGSRNGKLSLILRESVSTLSEVKPKHLILSARDMDQSLIPSGKRIKACDRFFETVGEYLHLVTCEKETHKISEYAVEHVKRKLADTGALEVDKGSECIGIKVGDDEHSILPIVLEGCALEISATHSAITELKRRIKRRHNNVSFHRPIEWSIPGTKELVARVHFKYKKKEEGRRTFDISELLRREFARKYGEIPGKYKATYLSCSIEITGYERRLLWFDRKIGSIYLKINRFWEEVIQEFMDSSMTLDPNFRFWFSPSSLTLGIEYTYERTMQDSVQVSIGLARPYKEKYGLAPDAFYLKEVDGNARAVGIFWDTSDKKLSQEEIDQYVRSKFHPPRNVVSQDWKVKQIDNYVYVEILYRVSLPLTVETMMKVLDRKYDIVDGIQYDLKGSREIEYKFWGFQKIPDTEEVE